MKSVSYGPGALKNLRRYRHIAARIISAIEEYAADGSAHANNVKSLVGSSEKRLWVGDFRVIFGETETAIMVTKVAPRGNVY